MVVKRILLAKIGRAGLGSQPSLVGVGTWMGTLPQILELTSRYG